MPVAAGVDEPDFGVDAFDEGVGDAEFDGGDDGIEVFVQAFAEFGEGRDAAAFGGGDPGLQSLTGNAGFVLESVEVTQLFFEGPGPADAAVGAGNLVDQFSFVVVEFVLPVRNAIGSSATVRRSW